MVVNNAVCYATVCSAISDCESLNDLLADKPRVGDTPADGAQHRKSGQRELPAGSATHPRSNGARLLSAIPRIGRLPAAPCDRRANYDAARPPSKLKLGVICR